MIWAGHTAGVLEHSVTVRTSVQNKPSTDRHYMGGHDMPIQLHVGTGAELHDVTVAIALTALENRSPVSEFAVFSCDSVREVL